jgi:hypothetical protein
VEARIIRDTPAFYMKNAISGRAGRQKWALMQKPAKFAEQNPFQMRL